MTTIHTLMPKPAMLSASRSRQAKSGLTPTCKLPAVDVMEQSEEDQFAADTQLSHVDLAELHSLMGHYAHQLLDIQKVRVAMGNRLDAMDRGGVPERHRNVATEQMLALQKAEHALDLHLARLARKHFMRSWIDQAPGIRLQGFGRLMGITGSLDRFPKVAKLWKYLGLAVEDGHAPRRQKGVSFVRTTLEVKGNAYSPQGKVLCHQLGKSIVRARRGPYRAAYDRKKAYYEQERPGWTQGHRHNAAMRYAVKELIKEMWLEWMRHSVD